jgi:hypothetical protein
MSMSFRPQHARHPCRSAQKRSREMPPNAKPPELEVAPLTLCRAVAADVSNT